MNDTPRTDAAYTLSTRAGIYEVFKESQDIERELAAAQQRIKRLEEAGDELLMWLGEDISESNGQLLQDAWNKAKEAKL